MQVSLTLCCLVLLTISGQGLSMWELAGTAGQSVGSHTSAYRHTHKPALCVTRRCGTRPGKDKKKGGTSGGPIYTGGGGGCGGGGCGGGGGGGGGCGGGGGGGCGGGGGGGGC
ncbi:hypothetical protein PGTUg99_025858 [Puccinia graminis f. sp. tritici]|uniref:Uncharacterized protein n=1 Tax=Puccinia graminis f. sp. tritici TaxID=56615 RepID=A0A5B0RP27_PUCGR|nr:hypothetical protein PGTUg99_025858 [Puccinia graminis f. sp. tritici]